MKTSAIRRILIANVLFALIVLTSCGKPSSTSAEAAVNSKSSSNQLVFQSLDYGYRAEEPRND